MAAPSVDIKVGLDKKAFDEGIKQVTDSFSKSFTEIRSALELGKKAFDTVISTVRRFTDAAIESEKSQRRLSSALKLVGDAHGETYDRLKTFNEELQRKIGLDDDDAAKLEAKLIALGVQKTQLERATKATIGLADATGKDLSRAAQQVARAFKQGGDEANRLVGLFAISEAQAATFGGQMKILAANTGELEETIGQVIIETPEIQQLFRDLNTFVGELSRTVSDLKPVLQSVLGTIIDIAKQSNTAELLNPAMWGAIATRSIAPKPAGFHYENGTLVRDGFHLENGRWVADTAQSKAGGVAGGESSSTSSSGKDAKWNAAWAAYKKDEAETNRFLEQEETDRKNRARAATKFDRPGSTATGDLGSLGSFGVVQGVGSVLALRQELKQKQELIEVQKYIDQIQLHETIDANEKRFQADVKAFQDQQKLGEQKLEFYRSLKDETISIGLEALGDFSVSIGQAMRNRALDIGDVVEQVLLTVGQGFGRLMIAIGTAAIAGGALSTAAPVFAGLFGGPGGVAAGAALIIAGGVLTGLTSGGASGGGGGSSSSAPRPKIPSTTSIPGSSETRGFRGESSEQKRGDTIINVSLGAGFVTGTPREVARSLREILKDDSLWPGTGRPATQWR